MLKYKSVEVTKVSSTLAHLSIEYVLLIMYAVNFINTFVR